MGVILARLHAVGTGELMREWARFSGALAARGLRMARDAALPPPAPPVAPLARVGLVSLAAIAAPAVVAEVRDERRSGQELEGAAYARGSKQWRCSAARGADMLRTYPGRVRMPPNRDGGAAPTSTSVRPAQSGHRELRMASKAKRRPQSTRGAASDGVATLRRRRRLSRVERCTPPTTSAVGLARTQIRQPGRLRI